MNKIINDDEIFKAGQQIDQNIDLMDKNADDEELEDGVLGKINLNDYKNDLDYTKAVIKHVRRIH